MKEQIAIVLTPGENHFQYINPLIESIKKNTTIDYRICVIAPKNDLSLGNNNKVIVKPIKQTDLEMFAKLYSPENKRSDIPLFVYSQLMIGDYFPEFDKLLFLEVDQYAQQDLNLLWSEVYDRDIKLGAVEVKRQKEVPENFKSVFPNKKYYNTGVVVHDTEYWIKNNLKEKCFEECLKQKASGGTRFRFYVQGAMNHALTDHFQDLDFKYNFMGLGGTEGIPSTELDSAVILHWNGKRKPWNQDGLYKDRYYR